MSERELIELDEARLRSIATSVVIRYGTDPDEDDLLWVLNGEIGDAYCLSADQVGRLHHLVQTVTLTWPGETQDPPPGDSMGKEVDQLLASIRDEAEELKEVLDDFDAAREDLEAGRREPDRFLDEDTADADEAFRRWEEGVYGVGRNMVFSYVLAGGGPSATLEVKCDVEQRPYGRSYEVADVWLEGSWWGPTHRLEVFEGDALWEFAERMVGLED